MSRTVFQLLLPALIMVGSAGCGGYVPVAAGDNFAYLYGKGAAAIRLQARVYQASEHEAVVYYKLRTADLLYKGAGGGGPYHAHLVIGYEVFALNDPKRLLDSASTYIKDQRMETADDKALIGSMPLKVVGNEPFFLRLSAHDLNRDAESTVLLRVDRGSTTNGQTFLPVGPNNLPIFTDFIPPGTPLKVRTEIHAGSLLYAAHYPPINKLPAPVFADTPPPGLDGPPDSTFTATVQADGTFNFTMGQSGFYHFRADSSSTSGFTLFAAPSGFPEVTGTKDMAAPLRYITSSKEWDALSNAPDQRKEVEKFWIDASGSRDRAREAIAAYYGRVESANRHFSSYTEGWKTDRGLVHIIFGTPSNIRLDPNGETWTYGDESNLMSLVFRFIRRNDPYSDNDLVLQRDPQLKSAWYRNVESWRNGRIMQN